MADTAALPKRALNARIEPAAWLQHEAFIREQYHRMDLEQLLKALQARGLPISKHQLTHQLPKWNLKKYKNRSEAARDKIHHVPTASLTTQSTSDHNTPSKSSYVPTTPKYMSSYSRHIWRGYERTYWPLAFPEESVLSTKYRSLTGSAETIIFSIPNEAAWRSLSKLTLYSAAVVSACDWWLIEDREKHHTTAEIEVWTCSSLSFMTHKSEKWMVVKLIQQLEHNGATYKEAIQSCSDSPDWVKILVRDLHLIPNDGLPALEADWPQFLEMYSESEIADSSARFDDCVCCHSDTQQHLKIRVKGEYLDVPRTLICRGDENDLPRLATRDRKLEFQLQKLLSKLVETPDYDTGIEFQRSPYDSWESMTPFEVLSIAINIHYLPRYRDDSRIYYISLAGREGLLRIFSRNVLKILTHIDHSGQLCKEKRSDINFEYLILNLEMGEEYDTYNNQLMEDMGNDRSSYDFFKPASKKAVSSEALWAQVLQPGEPDVMEEVSRSRSLQSVSTEIMNLAGHAAPASRLKSGLKPISGFTSANSEPPAFNHVSGSPVSIEMEIQRPLDLEEPSKECGGIHDIVKESASTLRISSSSRRSSPESHYSDKSNLHDVATGLEWASGATIVCESRPETSRLSSGLSSSRQGSRKHLTVREIVDPTLASGVIVAHDEDVARTNFDCYAHQELIASFSETQISDTMRDLHRRHSAKAFDNGSHLSLPSTRSSNLGFLTLKDFGFGSISTGPRTISSGSTSHGRRRKKVKRQKDPREDEGLSNGLSLGIRFNR